jgi:hypothetical protein
MTEPIYRRVQKGKSVRYEEITIPKGNGEIPLTDVRKIMLLHIALAAFETVRISEKPKSTRYCKINTAIDRILEQINVYHIDAWPMPLVNKASKLTDIFNVMIKEEFGDL